MADEVGDKIITDASKKLAYYGYRAIVKKINNGRPAVFINGDQVTPIMPHRECGRFLEGMALGLGQAAKANEYLTLLEELISQSCTCPDGKLDSMAISTNAEAMLELAELGKVEIISHEGRRVIGRWKT